MCKQEEKQYKMDKNSIINNKIEKIILFYLNIILYSF